MLDYEKAYNKLCNHGNLPSDSGESKDDDSMLHALWQTQKQGRPIADLERYSEDVIACLEVVNRHLNGPIPSENLPEMKPDAVDRRLSNAIGYILHNGWKKYRCWERTDQFDHAFLNRLAQALQRISCAWLAVLDGDIDSLREHLELELPEG